MKGLIFTLLVFCSLAIHAQATTEIEYIYMKNGFREIEEKGNDLKKGYIAEDLNSHVLGDVTLKLVLLKRVDGSIAGIILKSSSTASFGSGTKYYCIPAANNATGESYGWDLFYKDVDLMTSGVKTAVIQWMSYRMMYELRKKGQTLKDSTVKGRVG